MGGRVADSDTRPREEEFYLLLSDGSELLQAGKADDARVHFERALDINPSHEQALNLLGLALFRLNQLARARQIFAELIYNNPSEPSLRLNLAMVHLKTSHLEEAKVELEHVLALNPDHVRATSYMGLVLERKGDLDRAAAFYEKAGNQKRADEIRAFRPTATGTFPLPSLPAMTKGAAAPPPPAAPAAPASAPAAARAPAVAPASTRAQAALTATAAAALRNLSEPPVPRWEYTPLPAPVAALRNASEIPAPRFSSMLPSVAATASAPPRRATEPPAPAAVEGARAPTSIPLDELGLAQLAAQAVSADVPVMRDDGVLAFPIPDIGYVRSDLLVALAGQFEVEPVYRRYRGKRTDSPFGGPDTGIVALLGNGLALLWPGDISVKLLALRNEELYLIERSLLAFTQGLVWENGRLPSQNNGDLDIVHLRGAGRLVVGTKGPLMTLPVRPSQPVTVHAARLIGWNAQLVPNPSALPEAMRHVPMVRFEGTGIVLAV
jgi:uncharacterized protein (AIM24 family)